MKRHYLFGFCFMQTPLEDSKDFAVLRFKAGPPYEVSWCLLWSSHIYQYPPSQFKRLKVLGVFLHSFVLCIFVQQQFCLVHLALIWVPSGSPSPGGDVMVYVWHKPAELSHSYLFCSCVRFCLCGPFNCISFNKFSLQLSVFWLFSLSYLCLTGPFNDIFLYESLR